MQITGLYNVESIHLQRASNAPVVIHLGWRHMGGFGHSSTLTIDREIAEWNAIHFAPDIPETLKCTLDFVGELDDEVIESRREIVAFQDLGFTETISYLGRTAAIRYARFSSPDRKDTIYMGSAGGKALGCPFYNLLVSVSESQYEALTKIRLANTGRAAKDICFALALFPIYKDSVPNTD